MRAYLEEDASLKERLLRLHCNKKKIKRTNNTHKELCKRREIEITGTLKRVFFSTDSAVVKA